MDAPEFVQPVERLHSDVEALLTLTNKSKPPRRRYRGPERMTAFYLPGDASGSGFGSALIGPAGRVIYESGVWTEEYREESSNFREADNLVLRVEELVKGGDVKRR